MGKLKDWVISDGMDDKEIEEMCCPNGSFTCGLLTKLKMKGRCNKCKSLSKTQANPEDLSANKDFTAQSVSPKVCPHMTDDVVFWNRVMNKCNAGSGFTIKCNKCEGNPS